jgi:ribonuclease HII
LIGVDEVGRGAWAGPLLVVAARVKPHNNLPFGITDSKLLSKAQKEQFYQQLLIVCDFGEGWVEVEEIDSMGLGPALKLGAMRAVGELSNVENEEICIDGSVNFLKDVFPKSFAKIKADINEPIVSSASVYAKVVRDRKMTALHYEMPQYGFKDHVGYGTSAHIEALKKYGVSKHHRKSFKPIMALL